VLSGHALYTTMLMQLLRVSNAVLAPDRAFGRAVIAALYEWGARPGSRPTRPACWHAGSL
jgi:hypothetical protein